MNIATKCPRPFDTITTDKYGNCFACECSGWLPMPVGNLQIQSLQQVLEGDKIKEVQSTIVDGSYKLCENGLCSYLQDIRGNTEWKADTPKTFLKEIRLGHDDSCNLSCPSCRTKKIFESRGTRLRARMKINQRIIDFLENHDDPIRIHIGSDGDPFASLVYRNFIRQCPRKPNITFSIQTNGLLLEKMYHKNKFLFEGMHTIGLSIDGCHKNSYEILRRGGNFEMLKRNLSFLKKIKQHHGFKVIFHCVVQKENYKEMLDYVEFAKEYDADRVWFNRIVDWKTHTNFKDHDIVEATHPEHKDFVRELDLLRPHMMRENQRFVEFPTLDIQ